MQFSEKALDLRVEANDGDKWLGVVLQVASDTITKPRPRKWTGVHF